MIECSFKKIFKKFRYVSLLNIRKYRVLSRMKKCGENIIISSGYQFLCPQYFEIGDFCCFGKNAWIACIDHWNGAEYCPSLRIGNRFSMERNCHIACSNLVEIGDNVLVGSNVLITDHYHGMISIESLQLAPADRPLWCSSVKIGNNVWIGDNVSVMPGVSIGNNVIIGANSVVTHNFPENVVIAGCPAKIIKQL